MTIRKITAIAALSLVATSCSKVPGDVIQPREMASIMADVHVGEAVVEINRSEYRTDSAKQLLKQSVYAKHGVTSQEVDSSLAWYGRNIERYMDVYDMTIEMLEHRIIESGNRLAAENALSIAGDSVDVWPGARYITFNDLLPSDMFTFSFGRDPNWERGDLYTWRAKFFNTGGTSMWLMAADYADGSTEYVHSTVDADGWREIKLQTDSTRQPVRIYGYFNAARRPGAGLRIDSLEMVRKRVNHSDYRRSYGSRYENYNLPTVIADTLNNEQSQAQPLAGTESK